jgi:hypothetical protein
MIWAILIILMAFSGFALQQMIKNVIAGKRLRKASPLHLGFAVDKLSKCCNAYVKLVGEANRIFGVHTTPTVFAINSHLIYSVACLRSIITSLSAAYLISGHSEYQVAMLRYWLAEVYPQHKIITDYSRDASSVPDLQKDGTATLVKEWNALAEVVCDELRIIHNYLADGLQGGAVAN